MTETEIEAFKSLAPLIIPELFDINLQTVVDDFPDYSMLTYELKIAVSMDFIIDRFEDQMELNILYHVRTYIAGAESQHCCAYSNPTFEHMYKVNAQSAGNGMVDTVYVTIFSSLEVMLESLKEDLELHSWAGETYSMMTLPALISDFM